MHFWKGCPRNLLISDNFEIKRTRNDSDEQTNADAAAPRKRYGDLELRLSSGDGSDIIPFMANRTEYADSHFREMLTMKKEKFFILSACNYVLAHAITEIVGALFGIPFVYLEFIIFFFCSVGLSFILLAIGIIQLIRTKEMIYLVSLFLNNVLVCFIAPLPHQDYGKAVYAFYKQELGDPYWYILLGTTVVCIVIITNFYICFPVIITRILKIFASIIFCVVLWKSMLILFIMKEPAFSFSYHVDLVVLLLFFILKSHPGRTLLSNAKI